MDRFQMAMKKPPLLKRLLEKVGAAKCPICGDGVFIPNKGFQMKGSTTENPTVFCKDMGHWVGYLSDTVENGTAQIIESH
jgi:hypothetical protein